MQQGEKSHLCPPPELIGMGKMGNKVTLFLPSSTATLQLKYRNKNYFLHTQSNDYYQKY